jgi:hypothetical protein
MPSPGQRQATAPTATTVSTTTRPQAIGKGQASAPTLAAQATRQGQAIGKGQASRCRPPARGLHGEVFWENLL